MNSSCLLAVDISKKETLEFYEHYLIYNGDKILYRDFNGVSYLYKRTSRSINFIPLGTTHEYFIDFLANGRQYKIKFSSEEKYDAFIKICGAINSVIKKFILINLLTEYKEKGGLDIASLKINSQGIIKRKLFGRLETLSWPDVYNVECDKGYVQIYQRQNNEKKYKTFFTASMSTMNAVMLPELLSFLFQVNGVVDNAALKELQSNKEQLDKPSHSVETVKVCGICNEEVRTQSQKFCAKCGSKLND
jgi:hypothetical protein